MSYLNCSRCALSIAVRFPSLEVEHCPRCLARSRIIQPMFRSPLPIDELDARAGSVRQIAPLPDTAGLEPV